MIIKDDFDGGSISDYSVTPRIFPANMKYPPSWDDDPWDDYEEEDDEESEDEND